MAAARAGLLWGAALLAGVAAAGAALPVVGDGESARIVGALSSVVAGLALVTGTLCLARWLVAGEAPALLLGAGTLVYGGALVGLVELFPLNGDWPPSALALVGALRPAALLVVGGLWAAGALAPVRTRTALGPGVLAAAVGGTVVLTAMVVTLPPVLAAPGGWTGLVVPVGAATLALLHGVVAWRRRDAFHASFALLMASLALAALAGAGGGAVPGPAAQLLRLTGLAIALRGALGQLLMRYRDQDSSLVATRASLAQAVDRVHASTSRAEEVAHEARSALMAIEGATVTLQATSGKLPRQARSALAGAVRGEIHRLQRLIEPVGELVAAFAVDELVAPIVAAERARGTELAVAVPPQLQAVGFREATGDAVRTLLDNARRYAPGPVALRANWEADRIVLRVEDRGPGVRAYQRGAIFARGTRGTASGGTEGSGLGLYLAGQALVGCDGQLWVDDRPGGGASFAVSLPAASAGWQPEEQADDGQHRQGRVDDDLQVAPAGAQRAQRGHRTLGGVGEAQQQRGRYAQR